MCLQSIDERSVEFKQKCEQEEVTWDPEAKAETSPAGVQPRHSQRLAF